MLNNTIFTQEDGGISMHIDVQEQCAGVLVDSITMFITTEDDEGYYSDGDLAVNWNTDGLDNDETADTMGTLLMRNLHSDDEVTEVMRKFYWEQAFDARLRELLLAQGFSEEAAGVNGSEWGMQDEGRASYDAVALADEVRKHFGVTVAA